MDVSTIVGIICCIVLAGITITAVVYLLSLKDKEETPAEESAEDSIES